MPRRSYETEKLYVPLEHVRHISDQILEQLESRMREAIPDVEDGKEKINKENDEYYSVIRKEVSLNIQKYLRSVIDKVSYSVVINNIDTDGKELGDLISDSQANKYLEPFDLILNEEVRQRYQEWEDCSVKASQLRKRAPARMNDIYTQGKADYLKEIDARIEVLRQQEAVSPSHAEEQETEPITLSEQELDDIATKRREIEESLVSMKDAIATLPQTRANIRRMDQFASYLQK